MVRKLFKFVLHITLTFWFSFFIAEIARNLSRYRKILEFPTEEDLRGTAQALLRVQKTYNINVSRIANGDFGDGSQNRLVFS